ncbi:putative LPS glycosyltransferase [Stachybotrys elegans]|uniref:LPS glycosyltransferase n=1 Tax=Stachybotrys elegans TaxID=80388 RepID=A0A8K0WMS3_9HYPO|nr:putative LPS glycosyltransferase [Stachybotrys elegans]
MFIFLATLNYWQSSLIYNVDSEGTSPSGLLHTQNTTLGFENIFVVGLPERTDRRDRMVLQAALSNLSIEFIDGPDGKGAADKAIPIKQGHSRLTSGALGYQRAHMNAIQAVVERQISSALILEDGTDWDIRIKEQMRDFALSSRTLLQPMLDSRKFEADMKLLGTEPVPARPPQEFMFGNLPRTVGPAFSPYGDNWDVLWVGNCGMNFASDAYPDTPKGRVIHLNDITVPERRYLWSFNRPFALKDIYPEHTRVVHHAQEGVCTLGYAVSQRGAQKLLHEVGMKDVGGGFDILFRYFCDGSKGRRRHICLTVQPALFHHYRPAGAKSAGSDIHGDDFQHNGSTDMVRWSVQLNADSLLEDKTTMRDQLPDGSR